MSMFADPATMRSLGNDEMVRLALDIALILRRERAYLLRNPRSALSRFAEAG